MQDITKILNQAKLHVISKPNSAFYASLLFSLDLIVDETVKTACTDGKCIRFGPDFFAGLRNTPQRVFLFMHEIGHVANRHMLRRGTRCPDYWNKACDYVINGQLVAAGFTMIPGGLLDRNFDGMSAEQVYDTFDIGDGKGKDGQDVLGNDVQDGEPGDAEAAAQLEKELTEKIGQAVTRSQLANDKPGSVPGNIMRELEELTNPKLPWETLLQRYVSQISKDDYTRTRPNRRYISQGLYLPSLYSEKVGAIDIYIDTSGSVSAPMLTKMLTEIRGILRTVKPSSMKVVTFDTQIQDTTIVTDSNSFKSVKLSGGGGTNIEDVLEQIKEDKPYIAIVFTDGYYCDIDLKTNCPLLYVIYDNDSFVPIHGQVIHMDNI